MLLMLLLALQDDVSQRLDEAASLYKQGHAAKSYQQFTQVLKSALSSDVFYTWLKGRGEDLIFDMINSEDRRFQDLGRRLMHVARPSLHVSVDADPIKEMIQNLGPEKPWDVRVAARYHLTLYAEHALGHLMPLINRPSDDPLCADVMRILHNAGPRILQGLCETLESRGPDHAHLRVNACRLLALIGHPDAAAPLARIAENPLELDRVKAEARVALGRLTSLDRCVSWLRRRLRNYRGRPDWTLALARALDDDDPDARDAASSALAVFGSEVEPELRKIMRLSRSPEVHDRVRNLLDDLPTLEDQALRLGRDEIQRRLRRSDGR
jgi:hypothetical protein